MNRHFPTTRLRRNRFSEFSRRLVRETEISSADFIYPMFVIEGKNQQEAIGSMPGIHRFSIDRLLHEVEELAELGIPAVALFPRVDNSLKTLDGAAAFDPDGLVPRAVNAIKSRFPAMGVICDGALDPYTSHGQDGIIDDSGYVMNDPTVTALRQQALVCAQAGADVIAPSDMMDGRVGAIRQELDE